APAAAAPPREPLRERLPAGSTPAARRRAAPAPGGHPSTRRARARGACPSSLPSVAIASGYQTLRRLPSRTFVAPRLEAEQVPLERRVAGLAGVMRRPAPPHRLRVEVAPAAQPLRREQVLRPAAQRAAQPGRERDPEPLLRAVEERARHVALEHAPQQPLALPSAPLEPDRQPPRELDDAVVEQRAAHLEAHAHARAIDLGEDVLGQVPGEVEELHALERLGEPAPARRVVEQAPRRSRARDEAPRVGAARAGAGEEVLDAGRAELLA